MQCVNYLKKFNLAFVLAAIIISTLFVSQPVFASGSIISWGDRIGDSSELASNDFVAIAAGGSHSLFSVGEGRPILHQATTM